MDQPTNTTWADRIVIVASALGLSSMIPRLFTWATRYMDKRAALKAREEEVRLAEVREEREARSSPDLTQIHIADLQALRAYWDSQIVALTHSNAELRAEVERWRSHAEACEQRLARMEERIKRLESK